jgi:acyl-CoA thioesterase-1
MNKLFLTLLLVFGVPAIADVSLADTARSDIADAPPPTVLVLGDSLSAGYGLAVEETWVSLLAARLAQEGYGHRVVNASVSGDTTSGGLARLGRALERHEPELVIIELGGNDGLRGLPLDVVRSNFEAMIEQSREAGAEVVLLGMRIPINYGPRYAESFHALYGELAQTYDLEWVEFFLDGVALDDGLMQADGIHPNAGAQPLMLDNAWPAVAAALAD